MVQWLRHHISIAGAMGSTRGQGTKILYASRCGKRKKDCRGILKIEALIISLRMRTRKILEEEII